MNIENQKQHSINSLLRHERARLRAIKQKSIPVQIAVDIAQEDELEAEDTPDLETNEETETEKHEDSE
jgi:hypothetical protein